MKAGLTLVYFVALFSAGLLVNLIWVDLDWRPMVAFFFGIPFGYLLFDLWTNL